MRRRVFCMLWLALAAGALSGAVAAAAGTGTKIRVSPGRGGIHTNFTLRFAIPDATGSLVGVSHADSILVTGPTRKGCVGGADVPLRAAPAHHAFKITLNPAHLDGHWCTGTFKGSLLEESTTTCGPGPVQRKIMCPQYVAAPRLLGRFRFTVR